MQPAPQVIIHNTNSNVNTAQATAVAGPMGYGKPKSKWVTLVLMFFGLHYFYLGKPIAAILFLFTGGGFFVWAALDLIRILSGTLKDGNGIPVQ